MVLDSNKIKNYFVDSNKLEKYENGTLDKDDVVILTINNLNSNNKKISINVDNFNGATLIIKNSIINDIEFISYKTPPCNLIITGTNMESCSMYLGKDSKVSIESCILKYLTAVADDISFKKIKVTSKDSYLFLGNKLTKKVIIDGVRGIVPEYICTVSASADDIDIINSKLQLNCYCTKQLKIDKSNLFIENLISQNTGLASLSIAGSRVSSKLSSSIKVKMIEILDDTKINNCNILCDSMFVFENKILDVKKTLITSDIIFIRSFAKFIGEKNFLNINNVQQYYLGEGAEIDLESLKYKNESNKVVDFDPDIIIKEREKLVKTLKLAEIKYNRPLKELNNK